MKKIVILYSGENFDPLSRFSAIAIVLLSFAEALDSLGNDVYINEFPLEQLREKQTAQTSSKINNFFTEKKNGLNRIKKIVPHQLKLLIKDISNFSRLKKREKFLLKTYKENKPDIIIELLSFGSTIGKKMSRILNTKFIVIFDSPMAFEYEQLHGTKSFFQKKIIKSELDCVREANKTIVYSPSVGNYLSKLLNQENISFFIHQFVDYRRQYLLHKKSAHTHKINACFIGSFLPWHKLELLIEAYELLRIEHYDFNLFIIGAGHQMENILKLKEKYSFSHEIHFTGFMDGEELEKHMQMMDIGIIANNLWYQAPVKLFQYSAAKLTIIAPATPTIKHIIKNSAGVHLFEPYSLDGLVENIKYALDNKDKLPGWGEANQQYIQTHYTMQIDMNKYTNLIRSLD